MTQLNLKLAEIVPEKVVVIDGKQYLILGENKSSTSESTPKKSKGEKRTIFKDVDPELERILDEEEEIERRALSPFGPDNAKSWGVDSDEPDAAEKAYAEFEAQVRTMNMNGVGSVEIARRFGINEITVLDILNRS